MARQVKKVGGRKKVFVRSQPASPQVISDQEFREHASTFISEARKGKQVMVVDTRDGEQITMVVGLNGLRIDIEDTDLDEILAAASRESVPAGKKATKAGPAPSKWNWLE